MSSEVSQRLRWPLRLRVAARASQAPRAIPAHRVRQGAKGDPGPPGPPFGVRMARSNCDATNCTVQCSEDEVLITAYCGARRNAALIPTERSATCRSPVPANSPVVAICMKTPPP